MPMIQIYVTIFAIYTVILAIQVANNKTDVTRKYHTYYAFDSEINVP